MRPPCLCYPLSESRHPPCVAVNPDGVAISELDASTRVTTAVDMYSKAIVLCGLSKSWGLPGLRLGWIASKDKTLLKQVTEMLQLTAVEAFRLKQKVTSFTDLTLRHTSRLMCRL